MRTRLIFAAICILTLPLWFSAFQSDKLMNSASFVTVAYAGHTTSGNWCECGTPGCLCDPGEVGGQSNRPVSDQNKRPFDQGASPIRALSGFDFGTGVLILAFALFVWARLRA
ncbi:MAG: hypothetical protein AABN33_24275 [Acidobacteriota bacterium]